MEPSRFSFLRQVLFADALGTAACVALMLLFAAPLASLLELPLSLLVGAALSLVPFVALVTVVAWPAQPRAAGVWLVIAVNVGWAIASALLAFSGDVTPNGLGYAFIAGQALFVVVAAELEYFGLRRTHLSQDRAISSLEGVNRA